MTPIDLELVTTTGGNATSYPPRFTAAEADERLRQIQQNVRSGASGNSTNDLMPIFKPQMMMMGLGGGTQPR